MPSPNSNALGYSFAPTFDNAEAARRTSSAPQTPLQVLSYRLERSPAVLGGFSPLATDQRSGVSNAALIQSVLRTVLGPEAAQMFLQALEEGGGSGQPPTGPIVAGNPSSPGLANPFTPPPFAAPGGAPGAGRPQGGGVVNPFAGVSRSGPTAQPGVQIGDLGVGQKRDERYA